MGTKWPDIVALLAALSFIALMILSRNALVGGLQGWPLALFGSATVAIGCWRYRHWWLLALLPVFLVPLLPLLALLCACGQGDCL